jgi:lactaldehyde dehydrogenase/glycolaldehyde dehydrogenase
VSKDRLDEVHAMVESAKKDGAKVVAGGEPGDQNKGYFYKPTVISNARHDMEIMQDEIFGPVIPIDTFQTLDEAIEKGNDTVFGLSSSVYSEDMNEIMRVVNELRFGETYVNRENFEAVQGYHAGFRKSGLGGADGKHGVEDFLATHVVYMQYNNEKN